MSISVRFRSVQFRLERRSVCRESFDISHDDNIASIATHKHNAQLYNIVILFSCNLTSTVYSIYVACITEKLAHFNSGSRLIWVPRSLSVSRAVCPSVYCLWPVGHPVQMVVRSRPSAYQMSRCRLCRF